MLEAIVLGATIGFFGWLTGAIVIGTIGLFIDGRRHKRMMWQWEKDQRARIAEEAVEQQRRIRSILRGGSA